MAWPRDHSTTALIGVGGIYETGSLCPEVTGSPLGAGQGLHGAHGLYDGHGGHSITTMKSGTEGLGLIWLQGAEGPMSVPEPEVRPELLKEPRGFIDSPKKSQTIPVEAQRG